ncbi:MAG TPA: hypothetical protein VHK65_02675 [Candidatus Dormibacteraeota bacterium]|nr:hypothetical protein [Candidatus Dormibacteraeota bacterium]
MRNRARSVGIALLVILLVGCGQPSLTSSPTASTGPSHAASPSPTPLFGFPVASGVTCRDLRSLGLERALLYASDQNQPDRRDVVLCDARDTARPRSLQALVGSSDQRFLGRDLIGYVALKGGGPSSPTDQFTSVVTTLNLTTGQTAELASSRGVALAAGWSADGSMVAYFTDSGGVHHFWLKRGGAAPVAFSTPAQVAGRGGSRDDMLLVAFSPDGQYVLVVDTFVYRLQLFRTSDGTMVYAAPSGGAGGLRTGAVWAHTGDRFYFRNNSGVYQWDASSGISSFIPGLSWSTPSLTTDDRLVAYALGTNTAPHVETRLMSSGATTAYAPWRDSPVFVAPTTLLAHEEAPCDNCMGIYNWTGKTLLVHTDTRAESDLGITGWLFGAFWPNN